MILFTLTKGSIRLAETDDAILIQMSRTVTKTIDM